VAAAGPATLRRADGEGLAVIVRDVSRSGAFVETATGVGLEFGRLPDALGPAFELWLDQLASPRSR
jgi:hypothetical protein